MNAANAENGLNQYQAKDQCARSAKGPRNPVTQPHSGAALLPGNTRTTNTKRVPARKALEPVLEPFDFLQAAPLPKQRSCNAAA